MHMARLCAGLLSATMLSFGAVSIDLVQPSSSYALITFRADAAAPCSVTVWDSPAGAVIYGPASCSAGLNVAPGSYGVFLMQGVIQAGKSYRFQVQSGPDAAYGVFQAVDSVAQAGGRPLSTIYSSQGGPASCTMMSGFPAPAQCTAPGELPLGTFLPPAVGGSYLDANFGATVRVLSNAGANNHHSYSSPTVLSATGKYAIYTLDNFYTTIGDTATGLPIRKMFRASRSWSSGEVIWDPTRDDTLYYLSSYWNGTRYVQDRLMKFNVLTGQETMIRDFSLPPYSFPNVTRGGTGDMSSDGWMQFFTDNKQVCVVQVSNGETYCASFDNAGGLGWSVVDYVAITKSYDRDTWKHYVIVQGSPANAVFEFDSVAKRLTFLFRGPELTGNGDGICQAGETCLAQAHAETFQDSTGKQYLLRQFSTSTPCALQLSSIELAKGVNMLKPVSQGGGRTDVATLANCGTRWPSVHIACSTGGPYCAISMENLPVLDPAVIRDGAPWNGELWVMRDNGAEIRRIAMHRSVIQSYFEQPRVCISGDGRKLLWDSNFGVKNAIRVVTANTGF